MDRTTKEHAIQAIPVARPEEDQEVSRRPPLAQRQVVLASFAVSRLALLAITVAAALVRHRNPLQLWDQWDARWYIGIARHGYVFTIHGKPALAFFPLLPLLVRAVMSTGITGTVAGIVLSNGAFLGALFYLRAFAAREWGSGPATGAVWLLALFPTALFTFAPYTESLFLLGAAGSLYHARRGRAMMAGLWAAVAILSHSTGLILLPAILLALRAGGLRSWGAALFWPAVAGAAFGAYLVTHHLSLTAPLTAQAVWHRGLTVPWTGFTASLQWLVQSGLTHIPWAIENVLQLAVTIVFLVLTALAWRALSPMERIYCAGFWLLVLLSPEWMDGYYAPFSSMDRFVLALFPLAGWAASRLSTRSLRRTLLTFGALMVGAAGVFLAGGWVG